MRGANRTLPGPVLLCVGEGPDNASAEKRTLAQATVFRSAPSRRTRILELTHEQRAAAEACGCAFIPATDEQVRRLTMQRRVFRSDGRAVLAMREGGYFETHGTLAALLAAHAAAASAKRGTMADAPAPPNTPTGGIAGSPAVLGGGRPAEQAGPSAGPAVPAVDQNPTPACRSVEPGADAVEPEEQPRPDAAAPATDAGADDAAPAEQADPEHQPVTSQPGSVRKPRQRRAGEPKTPRWVTAGKERRGRLK